MFLKYAIFAAAFGLAFFVPELAFAQTAPAAPDISGSVSYINTNGPTMLGVVGGAMVTIAAVAVLWKWAKASIFG